MMLPINYFSSKERMRVINRIKKMIDIDSCCIVEKCVIESNTTTLSTWGETIASILKAKHVIYLLGENLSLERNYNFFNFKLEMGELAGISQTSLKSMFIKHRFLDENESKFLKAGCFGISQPTYMPNNLIENCPLADITIGYYGRVGKLINEILNEIIIFANKYNNLQFNFIVLDIILKVTK